LRGRLGAIAGRLAAFGAGLGDLHFVKILTVRLEFFLRRADYVHGVKNSVPGIKFFAFCMP
jgi:hypothetical protein